MTRIVTYVHRTKRRLKRRNPPAGVPVIVTPVDMKKGRPLGNSN
jgi:hypothetical protein